jgi:DNA-binding response OmpR family regulator
MHDDLRGSTSAKAGRARQRILLVTPEPVLGVALSQYLTSYFAHVALATSLETARSMLATSPFDALVLDVGLEHGAHPTDSAAAKANAAACLVSACPALHGRVIMLADDLPTPRLTGVREVLAKPVPGSELLRAIDGCLGPRLHRAGSRHLVRPAQPVRRSDR